MAKKATKKPAKKIVKKTKKVVKPTVSAERRQTLMDRIPKTEVERLELLLFFTERAITPRGGGKPDEGMVRQAERIKLSIEAAKKAV